MYLWSSSKSAWMILSYSTRTRIFRWKPRIWMVEFGRRRENSSSFQSQSSATTLVWLVEVWVQRRGCFRSLPLYIVMIRTPNLRASESSWSACYLSIGTKECCSLRDDGRTVAETRISKELVCAFRLSGLSPIVEQYQRYRTDSSYARRAFTQPHCLLSMMDRKAYNFTSFRRWFILCDEFDWMENLSASCTIAKWSTGDISKYMWQ